MSFSLDDPSSAAAAAAPAPAVTPVFNVKDIDYSLYLVTGRELLPEGMVSCVSVCVYLSVYVSEILYSLPRDSGTSASSSRSFSLA